MNTRCSTQAGSVSGFALVHLAVLGLCGVQLTGCQARGHDDAEPALGAIEVVCEAAHAGNIAEHVELRGVVRPPPEREVLVSSLVAGRLREVRIHEGDRVTKGQVLAVVDDPALSAATTEAEAGSASAEAGYETARGALARAERLFTQGIAAKREVEQAKAAAAAAEAEVKAKRAHQGMASAQLARAQVTTPIDGVVVRLHRAPGDVVDGTSQTPLAVIADPSVLELRADAPAAALVRLQTGASVDIHLDALPDQLLHGRLAVVSPSVDTETALGSVRIAIDKSSLALKIGLAGHADIQMGERQAVTLVPSRALRRSTTGVDELVVCAADNAGKLAAQVRSVKIGVRQGDVSEVKQGVGLGELVVVDHALGLQDGAALVARQPAATAAEPAARPGASR
ncbi:MAG TPA: efflux RND transporter periplasmic adaptor subunit [Polyangiales bacterium]